MFFKKFIGDFPWGVCDQFVHVATMSHGFISLLLIHHRSAFHLMCQLIITYCKEVMDRSYRIKIYKPMMNYTLSCLSWAITDSLLTIISSHKSCLSLPLFQIILFTAYSTSETTPVLKGQISPAATNSNCPSLALTFDLRSKGVLLRSYASL